MIENCENEEGGKAQRGSDPQLGCVPVGCDGHETYADL